MDRDTVRSSPTCRLHNSAGISGRHYRGNIRCSCCALKFQMFHRYHSDSWYWRTTIRQTVVSGRTFSPMAMADPGLSGSIIGRTGHRDCCSAGGRGGIASVLMSGEKKHMMFVNPLSCTDSTFQGLAINRTLAKSGHLSLRGAVNCHPYIYCCMSIYCWPTLPRTRRCQTHNPPEQRVPPVPTYQPRRTVVPHVDMSIHPSKQRENR